MANEPVAREPQQNEVDRALDSFRHVEVDPTQFIPAPSEEIKNELDAIKSDDYKGRLELRKLVFYWLIGLLVGQNVLVYSLVGIALFINELSQLQPVFAILTGATLIETGVSIKYIVQYLFNDIKYHK